jgi:hypothetical protein
VTEHPVDFRLVHNSFATMFWRSSILDETVEWLRTHVYDIVEFDAGSWKTACQMFEDVAEGSGSRTGAVALRVRETRSAWPGQEVRSHGRVR